MGFGSLDLKTRCPDESRLVVLVEYLPICGVNLGRRGNVYPYTVTDDRLGRNKKGKDNGKRIFPDEIVLGNLVIMRFSRVLRGVRLVQISRSPLR